MMYTVYVLEQKPQLEVLEVRVKVPAPVPLFLQQGFVVAERKEKKTSSTGDDFFREPSFRESVFRDKLLLLHTPTHLCTNVGAARPLS